MTIFERIYMTISMLPTRLEQRGNEKGAAMVEYALLVAGMALVVAAAVALFKGKIDGLISGITL